MLIQKIECHIEVVGLLRAPSVEEISLVFFVRDPRVASSVVRPGFSCGSVPITKKAGVEIGAIKLSHYQFIHQRGLHLCEVFLVLTEEQTFCMLSKTAMNMRIQQTFSLVWFKSLTLFYSLLDRWARVSFVTTYVSMNFDIDSLETLGTILCFYP